jgi:hypothetical protein
MSCHDIGFNVHNPDDLRNALKKRAEQCSSCGSILIPDVIQAKVIDPYIYYRAYCAYCDMTTARSIKFYAPKDV